MPAPTTADVLQWQAWLAAARLAYHNLMTGQAAVEVAVDGATYMAKFTRPDADKLQAYISRLEGQIAAASPCGERIGGAIGVVF